MKNSLPNKKRKRSPKEHTYLEKDTTPEKIKEAQERAKQEATNILRFLVLNAENAFNMIMDRIIRVHYKRLDITTPVRYITNVSNSSKEMVKQRLEIVYWISSREW